MVCVISFILQSLWPFKIIFFLNLCIVAKLPVAINSIFKLLTLWVKNKGFLYILYPPKMKTQNIKTFFVSIQQPEHRCFRRSATCEPFQIQQPWLCWTTLGGFYTESSALKPSLLALHTAANNSLLATAMLVIHCCLLLTEMISVSPTWELCTKAWSPPALGCFWWLAEWLRKVRSQVADLFCCSNSKRL